MDAFTKRIAETAHTVLITGRTGTGKSHLAREIHNASPRKNGRFVTINLATLSESLMESELFGHERGSFSGADARRTGRLECANGGTAFLDEIGEIPLRLQTKLLEALNSHTISPVGSNREIKLDIRIVAATNRSLREMVEKGEFREDLFFRLNTFEIHIDDLRKTPERIPQLARTFAGYAAERQGRPLLEIRPELMQALELHSWPGNIRELRNCMDFVVAMSPDGVLGVEALPPRLRNAHPAPSDEDRSALLRKWIPSDYRVAKADFERIYFAEIMRRFDGQVNVTARESGLSKATLIDKIRRYQIDIRRLKFDAHIRENP